MEKPNRDQRRRNKFGGGRSSEHGGWPTVQPNPVFAGDEANSEAASSEATSDAAPEDAVKAPQPGKATAKPADKGDGPADDSGAKP